MGIRVNIHTEQDQEAEDATALLQTDSRNGSKLAQSPAISVHSCIKTGKTSHRRNLHSTSFRPSVEVQIIAEDYSFSQEVSIQHGDLVDWDDKPWQLWMRDSQNNWYRRAPQSEQAVSSCDSVDQNQGFFPPIQQFRITYHHGRPEAFGTENLQTGHPEQGPEPPKQRLPLPAFLQHLLGMMMPTEDEWNDEPNLDFFVRTWYIHHIEYPKCESSRIIELDRNWHRWHDEILQGWHDYIHPQQACQIHVVQPDPPRHRDTKGRQPISS